MPPRNAKRKSNTAPPSTRSRKSARTNPPKRKPFLKTPAPPDGAAAINLENGLHNPPRREEEKRPWFLYDLIQPVAMFRRLPTGYNRNRHRKAMDIDEGDDSDALTETPGEDRKPVAVPGYV